MACGDDCSNSDGKTCKPEEGRWDPISNSNSVYDEYSCPSDETYYSGWEYVHSVNAVSGNEGHNVMGSQESQKWFRVSNWFTDHPDPLLEKYNEYGFNECDNPYGSRPMEYEYVVGHGNDSTDLDFQLEEGYPKDDESGIDEVVNIALSIAGSTSPYATVAATVAKAFINEGAWDPVKYDSTYDDYGGSNQNALHWDIKAEGKQQKDFPRSECDVSDVRFLVDPVVRDQTYDITAKSKAKFDLAEYDASSCPCDKDWIFYRHTTDWATQTVSIDCKPV